MQKVQQHRGVLDLRTIDALIKYYEKRPITNTRYLDNGQVYRHIKSTDYNIIDGLVYKLLNSKITELVGKHQFTGGHYLDAYHPYLAHFDTDYSFKQRGTYTGFESGADLGIGCLIPLSENAHQCTVFFECFNVEHVDAIEQLPEHLLTGHCTTDLIDHHSPEQLSKLQRLNIDQVCEWHLGDMLVFDRRQLHCSGNFVKYIPNKQCLVLWV